MQHLKPAKIDFVPRRKHRRSVNTAKVKQIVREQAVKVRFFYVYILSIYGYFHYIVVSSGSISNCSLRLYEKPTLVMITAVKTEIYLK